MRKGFTLIELLIVIAIIGLLATLAIVSLTTAQQKARDTKRLADVKQIQNAVELFFSEDVSGLYPNPATWAAFGGAAGLGPYITTMPIDPNNNTVDYYAYMVNTARTEYYVGTKLEDEDHASLNGDDDSDQVVTVAGLWNNAPITSIDAAVTDGVAFGGTGSLGGIYCNDSIAPITEAGAYCLSE